MNLSEWSDVRVNCEIESIKNPFIKLQFITEGGVTNVIARTKSLQSQYILPDYCNDDALAFRLMVDNKLSLLSHREEVCVYSFGQVEMVKGASANRAIAECFILMNQGGDK